MEEEGKLLNLYKSMIKIRRCEEKIKEYYFKEEIPGLVHLTTGQEGAEVGVIANLRKDDVVWSTHRPHGHFIAKGGNVHKLMGELFGKVDSVSKGKGGTMHIGDPDINMFSTAIVGANIPLAVGIGLAFKLRGSDRVCACFFGDGAVNTGAFHEGLNLAAVWKTPVIFVCENNMYAISTHLKRVTLIESIAERAAAYKMPAMVVDGMDVLEVSKAAAEAVKRAREGQGPSFIECKTYRLVGHGEWDARRQFLYRKEEEIEEWRKRDPIELFKTKLVKNGILTKNKENEIEQEMRDLVEGAVEYAKKSTYPEPSEAQKDVFCED